MNTNSLAFTALCKEYCTLVSQAYGMRPADLTQSLLRLLPRIYICASDLKSDFMTVASDSDAWIEQSLTEEQYDDIRQGVASRMGEHDVYLEVFDEDMKYSDTPVSASVSENIADIYQVLYDFLNTARLGTDAVVDEAIVVVKHSFREYWSATLCNVLRALNFIWQHGLFEEDRDSTDNSDMV